MQQPEMFFNFGQSDKSLKKGDLLIAEPFLADANFERAVVLICEHNASGTFGLVVNKPTNLLLSDVLKSQLNPDEKLFLGGPVEQNSLHFIHDYGKVEGSIQLGDKIYWGGNFNSFSKLHASEKSENSRFFAGYSGWGREQLEEEFEENTWWVYRGNPSAIFKTTPTELWKVLVKSLGGKFKIFSNYPINPRLN